MCPDHQKFLISCLGKMQGTVSSLEQKVDEIEKKYEESNKLSEERLKQATEAEERIIEMKLTVQRLLKQYTLTMFDYLKLK